MFFSNVLWGTRSPFLIVIFLLCRSPGDSLQWKTIPDGSPSEDWQSTVGRGDVRFEPGTACLQSGFATNELLLPWTTTTPPELQLLPLSHHSHKPPLLLLSHTLTPWAITTPPEPPLPLDTTTPPEPPLLPPEPPLIPLSHHYSWCLDCFWY